MPSTTGSNNEGGVFSKPIIAIPLFTVLILLAVFIPRFIQPSFPSGSRAQLYYPRVSIKSLYCNGTLVINVSSRQNIRVEQVVINNKEFNIGTIVNDTLTIRLNINCSKIPRIALVKFSYNGRIYNRYVYVAHRCYK